MAASSFFPRDQCSILAVASILLIPFPSVAFSDVLVLKSGREISGAFLSVNLLNVKFATPDGLESDYPRDQVLGVFAKGENPAKPAKQDELGFGASSVKGVLVYYGVKDPYVIYAKAKNDVFQSKALSPKDAFRFIKLFESELLEKSTPTGIAGTWTGVLFGKLRVSLAISEEEDGKMAGIMKFANQDRAAVTFDEITVKKRSIRMKMEKAEDSHYEAELDESGTKMTGEWVVSEQKSYPLTLKRDLAESQMPTVLNKFDRGNGFAKSTLEAMKQLQDKNLVTAISLAKRYFEMQPTGSDVEKVRKHFENLQEALRKEVGNLFKLSGVTLGRGGDGLEYLTYHIYSKAQSFEDLRCSAWIQLEDGTVCEESFLYYTVRQGNKHYDSVGVPMGMARAVRYRVVLEYEGMTASIKEGGPPGEGDWWLKRSQKLSSWGLVNPDGTLNKKQDYYFSHSLGKKGIDRLR